MSRKGPLSPISHTGASARPRHHYISSGLALIALGLFAAAASLAVVKPQQDFDRPEFLAARQTLVLPELQAAEASPSFSSPFIDETLIRPGDTLASILQRLNINAPGLQNFLVQDRDARSIYKLYPGRNVQVAQDDQGNLTWLRYYHTPGTLENGKFISKWLEITPKGDGYSAQEHIEATDTGTKMAEGEISSSLFAATDAADIPDAITLQMAEILGSKVDFMRGLRKGDRFRVVYETHTHEGRQTGTGRVVALEFINDGKTYDAVWYQPAQGAGGYYDFDGTSLKGAFLRSALKFSRITSTFGSRTHPVFGYTAQHKGVDYAAPTGTPIHATADGIVEYIGNQRGYGNIIVLKHQGNISTAYAHQSRFAPGIKKGDRVEQGQLIGYVGATGWATGPHLHYELRVANQPTNPLAVDLPVARALEGADRKAFASATNIYKQQIQLLASLQQEEGVQVAAAD